jgi:hypothetical protein
VQLVRAFTFGGIPKQNELGISSLISLICEFI